MPMSLPIFACDEPSRVRDGIVGIYVAISFAFGAGLAATFTTAHAADATFPPLSNQLPLKAPPARATPYFDWSGFYVGGHVGYARRKARGNLAPGGAVRTVSRRIGRRIGRLQDG